MPSPKRPLAKKYSHIRLRVWVMYWLLVSLLVVFIIMNGIITFGWNAQWLGFPESSSPTIQILSGQLNKISAQSAVIEKEVNDLQARIDRREAMDKVRNSLTKTTDGRLQLTTSAAKVLLPCSQLDSDYPFYAATTTHTTVINLPNGDRLRVPFDDKWGNAEFAVLPSEVAPDMWPNSTSSVSVRFGALRVVTGMTCDWQRDYKVYVLPKRTAKASITQETGRALADNRGVTLTSKTVTLGNHQVIHFVASDMLTKQITSQWTEVLGKKQNYVFVSMSKTATQAAIDNIIKSLAD